MKPQLPEFTQLRQDTTPEGRPLLQIDFTLAPDSVYFQGHFPEAPLLPGVTQLDWAAQIAADHWHTPRSVSTIEVLKFNDMLLPRADVTLRLEFKRDNCVVFRYQCGERAMSSGRLIFAEPS
ncbi:hydroxymyristoyl-ACP dehydratase [Pseudidiomarina sediminum]|uniref:Hydroxymyristoyl-ACP dehydratase n=1 Tax=Pseudidiomarina sediminum TaxID=431675 RepID=A0A432Z2B0_9GAMM|nr:3-hydroxymyristoyl-ACP dehydratase [Pseudidiomarina sediminum]RUO72015.1 hydroxymyristoyl-ACP dehydratase [Pseudidiomarina sediminum]